MWLCLGLLLASCDMEVDGLRLHSVAECWRSPRIVVMHHNLAVSREVGWTLCKFSFLVFFLCLCVYVCTDSFKAGCAESGRCKR